MYNYRSLLSLVCVCRARVAANGRGQGSFFFLFLLLLLTPPTHLRTHIIPPVLSDQLFGSFREALRFIKGNLITTPPPPAATMSDNEMVAGDLAAQYEFLKPDYEVPEDQEVAGYLSATVSVMPLTPSVFLLIK